MLSHTSLQGSSYVTKNYTDVLEAGRFLEARFLPEGPGGPASLFQLPGQAVEPEEAGDTAPLPAPLLSCVRLVDELSDSALQLFQEVPPQMLELDGPGRTSDGGFLKFFRPADEGTQAAQLITPLAIKANKYFPALADKALPVPSLERALELVNALLARVSALEEVFLSSPGFFLLGLDLSGADYYLLSVLHNLKVACQHFYGLDLLEHDQLLAYTSASEVSDHLSLFTARKRRFKLSEFYSKMMTRPEVRDKAVVSQAARIVSYWKERIPHF